MNMKVGSAPTKPVEKDRELKSSKAEGAEAKPAAEARGSKISPEENDKLMAGLAMEAYKIALKKKNQARREKSDEVFIEDLGGGKIDVRLSSKEFAELCKKLPNPEALYPMQHFNESGYRITQFEGDVWIEMKPNEGSYFADKSTRKPGIMGGGPSAVGYFEPARNKTERSITKSVNKVRIEKMIEADEKKTEKKE